MRPELAAVFPVAILLAAAAAGQENPPQARSAAAKRPPLSIVEGTVRDRTTGQPIADAEV